MPPKELSTLFKSLIHEFCSYKSELNSFAPLISFAWESLDVYKDVK